RKLGPSRRRGERLTEAPLRAEIPFEDHPVEAGREQCPAVATEHRAGDSAPVPGQRLDWLGRRPVPDDDPGIVAAADQLTAVRREDELLDGGAVGACPG